MPDARAVRLTPAGDRRRWIVSAALFAPLLLLLFFGARTWRAEQRYAAVTHRVVHDNAAIAAWQYARRANADLHDETMRAFAGIATGHQRTGANERLQPPEAIIAAPRGSSSALLGNARFVFTYDARSRSLVTAGGDGDNETREMIRRRLERIAATIRGDDEPHRVVFDSTRSGAHAIALWMVSAPDELRGVYGVVADPAALQPLFSQVVRNADLLPAATSRAKPDSADIAVRLTRNDGGVVFATGASPGGTAATDSASLQWGELRTTLDLSPALANALLVGGAPASQLPSLALMILGASLLAVVGLVQERRSRELARLRGRFVANVSHELRTPLAQISMFAETLALGRERSVGEGRHFASIILAEARRLTGLVESVLRFSRLESHRETLRLEVSEVGREIESAVEAFTPVADAADVTIAMHTTDDTWALLDRGAFRQIVLNLLDNALKHGGQGTSVDVSSLSRGSEAHLVVDDSGKGIPEEWRERVFEPFVRVEQGKAAGAGIGLAVVRDLVVAHGGRVWIESSPSGGARFVVAIPSATRPAQKSIREPVEVQA